MGSCRTRRGSAPQTGYSVTVDFQRGHYHFNHRHVGKTSSAPGTAAAKVRYMTRRSACEDIYTVGLAAEPNALQRAANDNETTSRKNGRVCDTFHIALPCQMTGEEQAATIRSFLWQLTDGGRARAFACLHGGQTHNPHVHVMFFDKDVETGKRVQQMSERGSTERMRALWERVCNGKLEEYGYDVRIDRRTLETQRQEQLEQLEQIEPQRPELPLAQDAPDLQSAMDEPEHPTEEDLAMATIKRDGPELLSYERVQNALGHDAHRCHLAETRESIAYLKARAESAQRQATELAAYGNSLDTHAMQAEKTRFRAEQWLGQYTKPDGRLRGFHVKLFGLEWKSPMRRQGEEVSRIHGDAEATRDNFKRLSAEARHAAEVRQQESLQALSHSVQLEHRAAMELERTYGNHATIEAAEAVLANTVQEELQGVTSPQVYADYEVGNLTYEEAVRACELLGDDAMVNAIEQRHRQEEEWEQEQAQEQGL